jgi:hypothetical protein
MNVEGTGRASNTRTGSTLAGDEATGEVRRLLKSAFCATPSVGDGPFLWLGNFEAERHWDDPGAVHLPSVSMPADLAIVNRMEEMALLLAGKPDHAILREQPDPDFMAYLSELGFVLPSVISINAEDRTLPVSELILETNSCVTRLHELAQRHPGLCLLPFGKTRLEESIGERARIPVAGVTAQLLETVNSKLYSRQVSTELGLRTIPGASCATFEDLERASVEMCKYYPTRLVLKEAMGVSGKGLVVLENRDRLERALAMLRRKAKPGIPCRFVLETWIDKLTDINYQILVTPDGGVRLLCIKEAVTRNGVHMGHYSPPVLSPRQRDSYEAAAAALGKRLFQSGFVGIAGIDSIIDQQGEVYPALEINARFNMSTYQLALDQMVPPQSTSVVKHYPLAIGDHVPFSRLRAVLESMLFGLGGRTEGVGIMCFGTVNCNSPGATSSAKGRLYVFLTAHDRDAIKQLDSEVQARLASCAGIIDVK